MVARVVLPMLSGRMLGRFGKHRRMYISAPWARKGPISGRSAPVVVLDRLSSRRDGVAVVDYFVEAGVVERYPEVFEQRAEPTIAVAPLPPAEAFAHNLRRASTDDSVELPDLRIEDDGIGV